MKIETNIDENTFWLALWSVIAICIATTIIFATWTYNDRAKTAFNLGYNETPVAGSSAMVWAKPELKP